MAKQRGNPNRGKPGRLGSLLPTATEFEQAIRKFELKPDEYVNSVRLREWALRNQVIRAAPWSFVVFGKQ